MRLHLMPAQIPSAVRILWQCARRCLKNGVVRRLGTRCNHIHTGDTTLPETEADVQKASVAMNAAIVVMIENV